VVIRTDGTLRAETPDLNRRQWVAVNYRVHMPHQSDLDLTAHNGGINIQDVTGTIRFETQNGGVTLDGLGGDVRGHTTNGGLSVHLAGRQWEGARLDVSTRNGGVDLDVPRGYSADLETGTVNGRFRTDIPITVQGDVARRVRTTLGDGGAPVRVVTTNGSVSINSR